MSGRHQDADSHDDAQDVRATARQWSRVALAFAVLFASAPLATKLLTGSWRCPGAVELSLLSLILAAYLHLFSKPGTPVARDPAAMLADAIRLSAEGQIDGAIAVLNSVSKLSPKCWQAFEYRAALHFAKSDLSGALADIETAIGLAPSESHLYAMRAEMHRALGDSEAAHTDERIAEMLNPEQRQIP